MKQKFTFSSKTFKQSLLSIDEYFYLTAPKVGTFAAFDDFECIFSCLRNPSCWSINLAVAKKRDAKIWCELLSSHKHRFPEEFRQNSTSRHISIMVGLFPTHNIKIQCSLISVNLSSLSLNISGRKDEEVTRIYSIDKSGLYKFFSSSFGSLHVFPPHAITVVAV